MLRASPLKRWSAAALVALSVLCALAPMAAAMFVTRVHASHCVTEGRHGGPSSPERGDIQSLDEVAASGHLHAAHGHQHFESADGDDRGDVAECCRLMCMLAILLPELAITGPSVSLPALWHRDHVADRKIGRLDRPPNTTRSC